jgi:CheY-like chemotaxis protein
VPAHEALAEAAERALEALRAERAAAQRAAAERDARAAARELPPPSRAPQPDDAAAWVDVAFAFQTPPAPAPAPLPPPAAVAPPPPAAPPPPHASSAAADAILFGPGPAFEPEPVEQPSGPAPRKALRRALIADDSLVARIFLGRLLEQRGWIVESVPDAAGLWNELRHGSWTLVCADFALPDATGRSHVQRLVDHFRRGARTGTLVVLTRDEEEERIALEAGASLSLRKPFDAVRLDALLAG